mmetsp:Transcript_20754/g.31157  ORF Transcript_20754/g.31157 Transcript_20754/m.31157 type:complete len:488 (+) Transcript_20754:187-1650(+)
MIFRLHSTVLLYAFIHWWILSDNILLGMQQQQQQQPGGYGMGQAVPSSNQSIASANYMNPNTMVPYSSTTQSVVTSPAGNHQHQQPYQNYMQQQQQQMPAQQPPPPSVQQQPPPSPPATRPAPPPVEVDDDFFGVFSTKSKDAAPNDNNNNQNQPFQSPTSAVGSNSSPRPPSEFEAHYDHNENVSILSKSTNGTARSRNRGPSPFDDPKFAPKPAKPQGLDNGRILAHNTPAGASALPDFDLVTHSGHVLARISFRTIFIKKWKQVFWITYGVNKLLVFRSTADFEDWISNPYLNKAQREFLVKLQINLIDDLGQNNVRGYQMTNQRMKNYNGSDLYQFKIERWMDYGPTIAAAFGSQNEREIFQLRTIFGEMLKRCPQDQGLRGLVRENQFTITKKSYEESPHITTPQRYGQSHPGHSHGHVQHHHNYSSNASTGRMYDQPSVTGYSTKSGGALSTPGDMGRRDPEAQAVAGYYPSAVRGRTYRY